MDERQGWLETSELRNRLSEAGYPTAPRQLERWREAELLPPVDQEQIYRGSIVWHPIMTLRQAIAIQRALQVKNRLEFVGPLLWAAGFEVGERHFRDRLERADYLWRRGPRSIRWLIARMGRLQPDRTIGDLSAGKPGLTGIIEKISRRLNTEEQARVVNSLMEIGTGEFVAHDVIATSEDLKTSEILAKTFAFDIGAKDEIQSVRLKLSEGFPGILKAISETVDSDHLAAVTYQEIQSARDDVRNVLKIAICLYDAMRWIYGANAFGLRFPAFVGRTMGATAIFGLTLAFARLRKKRGTSFYSSEMIASLADQAEHMWLAATYFRELAESHVEFAHIIGPKRLKAAFSSAAENQKLCNELMAYKFPNPEFRPWNSWQKLGGKTMSTGLLIAGVGSPDRLDRINLPSTDMSSPIRKNARPNLY